MRNIFQGNTLLLKTVARVLGYTENIEHSWFTQDIYFSTFFYLTKRFGAPVIYDDYKDAGVWNFKVKQYTIQVYMNSSWVSFIMFGKIGNEGVHSPYVVKYRRRWCNERNNLVSLYGKTRTEREVEILTSLFEKFTIENSIDVDAISGDDFDKQYGQYWFEYINKYNNEVIGVNGKEFTEKYGEEYQNAYTRHALKTLEQFLKNMLTPIWIRDVPYNIKGSISDQEAANYSRYKENISIIFKENIHAPSAN